MKVLTTENVLSVINSLPNLQVTSEQLDEELVVLGIDSITFIRIIVALEEAFECEIPDSKLLISEMNTVERMIGVLQSLYHHEQVT